MVAPSTGADEQLVLDIVKFLAEVVKLCEAGTMPDKDSAAVNETLGWIGEMLLNNSGALYHLLTRTDLSAEMTDRKPSSNSSSSSSAQATRCVYLSYNIHTYTVSQIQGHFVHLENLEYSGISLNMENSGNSQGIL